MTERSRLGRDPLAEPLTTQEPQPATAAVADPAPNCPQPRAECPMSRISSSSSQKASSMTLWLPSRPSRRWTICSLVLANPWESLTKSRLRSSSSSSRSRARASRYWSSERKAPTSS